MNDRVALAAEPLIELTKVGVCYWVRRGYLKREPIWALRNVSLTLRRGQSLGVIGRNGAGKTTLLQLMAGIIEPDRGSMINHGYQASVLSLQVGFLPYLTGRENAYLSGMLLGLDKAEIGARMDDIVNFSELGDFIDRPIYTYSSGMTARLGFSVAFQMDPDILLIDEVLGVGDAAFREKSAAVLREKLLSDKTIVLVSHNAASIKDLCDQAVWIEHGVTQAEGSAEEVVARYVAFTQMLRKDKARAEAELIRK